MKNHNLNADEANLVELFLSSVGRENAIKRVIDSYLNGVSLNRRETFIQN